MKSEVLLFRQWTDREWVALLTVCLLSILLVTYPIFDFDLYWHLANGREMVNSSSIISEEVFSYTHPGEHFANHEWLGQIIFYVIWNNFGAYGLFGLKILLVSGMVLLLYRTLINDGSPPVSAGLLCLLAIFAGINRYHERPELFSLINTAFLGYILYGFRAQWLSRNLLWIIPLLLVVWDWLHGAVYGLTFLTLFVAGENAKHHLNWLQHQSRLSMPDLKFLNRCFAVTLLAMLINPFGLRSYGIVVGYVTGQGNFNQVITEYLPVNWDEFNVFILLFAWTAILALRYWRRMDFTHLLLMTVFCLGALRFNRATGVAALVILPIIADLLRMGMNRALGNLERKTHVATLVAAGALLLWQGYGVKFGAVADEPDSDQYHYLKMYDLSFGYNLDESLFPVGAVNFIKAQKLKGHLYNSGNLGGYLSYFIAPERKIFQYNVSVFGDPFYYARHPDDLAKWDIDYAIIDTEGEMNALFSGEEWAAVYRDEASTLVVRRTPRNRELINQHEIHYFSPVLSDSGLLARAADPLTGVTFTEEMGDNLAYREDDRIASVWADILASHPEMSRQPHIQQLLARSLKYNHIAKLVELAGHTKSLFGR